MSLESHSRSIVKAVVWRVLGTFFTTAVAWLVTGSAKVGVSIGLLDSALKIGAFYAHERAWQKVRWGRTDGARDMIHGEGI